jgi:hypothetical protein
MPSLDHLLPDPAQIPQPETQTLVDTEKQEELLSSAMTKGEAIRYAITRGFDDSIRGVKQMFGQLTGNEDILEELKKKDRKLREIFDHPEYGSAAQASYFGSAMFLDPVGWVPILGWRNKAKKIKEGLDYGMTAGQSLRYGAASGAIYSGAGYYGEDDVSRGEGILLGAVAGGGLAAGANAVRNAMAKRSKGKITEVPNLERQKELVEQGKFKEAKEGVYEDIDEYTQAAQEAMNNLAKEEVSPLSKSLTGLNLRKNYEEVVGTKVWDLMVRNWGEGLAGAFAFTGGYTALEDPDASELEKFGAALAYAVGAAGGVNGLKRVKINFKGEESTLGELISKGMVDNYGLMPEYVDIKKETLAEVNTLRHKFLEISKYLDSNLSADEQKAFYAMLHGNFDAAPELINLTKPARDVIKTAGQELVDAGLLNPKTFRKNAESYLHRSYESKLTGSDKDGFKKIAKRFKIIGDELRPRGITLEPINRATFVRNKQKYLADGFEDIDIRNVPDDMKVIEQFTPSQWKKADKKRYKIFIEREDGKIFAEDLKKIKPRRDLTKEERTKLGEIENASFGIAETGRLMTNDLAAYKLFSNISRSEFSLSPKEFANKISNGSIDEDAWVKISDNYKFPDKPYEVKEWGKLAGSYVPREVYDDLTVVMKNQGDELGIKRSYLKALNFWKKTKTVFNPTVHVNNTMSNVMLYDLANGQYKLLPRAIEEMRKGLTKQKDAYFYNEAAGRGVFEVDLLAAELNKETADILKKALNDFSLEGVDEVTGSLSYNKKILGLLKKAYQKTGGRLEEWYRLEDQIFRMALFMDRVNKKMPTSEAAIDAKKWFIDYDINAPLITALKTTATPFISYTYRVIPLLAETAAKRPWKFAKWSTMGYLLNEAGSKFGVGSEEAERTFLEGKSMFGVPGLSPTLIKTPLRSGVDDSVPLYVNVERFIPGGDIFQAGQKGIPLARLPFSEMITGNKKYLTTPQALNPNFGLLGEIMVPAMFGVDPFTHQKLEGLGVGNDAEVKINHILSRLIPNFPAPYLTPSFSSEKIERAFAQRMSGKREMYKADFSPLEAILSTFGFKLQPVDFQKLLRIEDAKYTNFYSNIRRQFYQLQREYEADPTEAKQEEIQEKINELVLRLENETRKANSRKYQAAEARDRKYDGGKIDPRFPVTDVTPNPAERENPYTGEPYLREEFSYGGVVSLDEPLGSEMAAIAAMQESGQATDIDFGAMPMEEGVVKRKQYYKGSKEGPISRIYEKGGEWLGVGAKEQRQNEKEAAALINEAVKNKLIDEREAVAVDKYGFVARNGNTGDVFNAVNHALLSYKFGDNVVRRTALQAKEGLQAIQGRGRDSAIDALNNRFGFDLRGVTMDRQEAGQKIIEGVTNSYAKLKAGEKLQPGKNLYFTFEDI